MVTLCLTPVLHHWIWFLLIWLIALQLFYPPLSLGIPSSTYLHRSRDCAYWSASSWGDEPYLQFPLWWQFLLSYYMYFCIKLYIKLWGWPVLYLGIVPASHSLIVLGTFLIILLLLIALTTCGVVAWIGVHCLEHIPGIWKFYNAWSLGPLGIPKIPPVRSSCQGCGSLVSH